MVQRARSSTEQDNEEKQRLLGEGAPANKRQSSGSSSTASESGASCSSKSDPKEKQAPVGICRICLEEDDVAHLESPCSCSGTQQHAHHDCIQRWVEEKGNLRCEICEQQYRGSYVVPERPASGGPIPLDELPLFAPLYIVDANGQPRVVPRSQVALYGDTDQFYQRSPGVSWCFTLVLFVMFLVVLHHTIVVTDTATSTYDGDTSYDSMSSGGASASTTYAGDYDSANDDYAYSLSFFMFWVATKALLIGVPLYTVARVAGRQARREQYEAMLRAAQYDPSMQRQRIVVHVRSAAQPYPMLSPVGGGGAAPGGVAGAQPLGANAV